MIHLTGAYNQDDAPFPIRTAFEEGRDLIARKPTVASAFNGVKSDYLGHAD